MCVITTVCLTDDLASGTFSNNNHTSDKKGTQKKTCDRDYLELKLTTKKQMRSKATKLSLLSEVKDVWSIKI